MLRVGLTGGLGSGKSTVAQFLRELGAEVIEADELGRTLMQPGQPVYAEILRVFGSDVADADGRLNRAKLAALVFGDGESNRLKELNAIVHPAVIEAQQRWMKGVFAQNPAAVAVVVSALIFEVERDARANGDRDSVLANWRHRIDRILVVTAPDEAKIARYVARVCPNGNGREAAEADARSRIAHQIPDREKAERGDYLIENTGDISALHSQTEQLWQRLQAESNRFLTKESLK
jgi:dephospho-CoA kinase